MDDERLDKIHALAVATKTDVEWIKKTLTDQEPRIRSLERKRWIDTGFAAAVASIFGFGTSHFGKF